jgi:nucleoid DNA-binding protein
MQKEVEKIIKQISHKYYIPVKDVEDIIKSQFLFVKEVIQSAERDKEESFKVVQLPKFGKFVVAKNRIKHIIKNKNGVEDK